MATNSVDNIFAGQITPRDFTKYTLGRGVTDFSLLKQFNMYEKGYPYLIVLKIPEMLDKLKNLNTDYGNLIANYIHLLEYDFKGLEGIEDMSADQTEINNGITKLDVITKVNWGQGSTDFSMKYQERQGSVFTRVNELYLRGIKDPRTQVKTYNGLLRPSTAGGTAIMDEAGYEHETFQFLYFVTDNTVRKIEKAYLIVSAQATEASTEMYNSEKGQIEFYETNVQYSGFPITGPAITQKATNFLDWINTNTVFEDAKFGYQAISKMASPGGTGGTSASSPTLS